MFSALGTRLVTWSILSEVKVLARSEGTLRVGSRRLVYSKVVLFCNSPPTVLGALQFDHTLLGTNHQPGLMSCPGMNVPLFRTDIKQTPNRLFVLNSVLLRGSRPAATHLWRRHLQNWHVCDSRLALQKRSEGNGVFDLNTRCGSSLGEGGLLAEELRDHFITCLSPLPPMNRSSCSALPGHVGLRHGDLYIRTSMQIRVRGLFCVLCVCVHARGYCVGILLVPFLYVLT
jgi:hypothetical protein